MTLVTVLVGPRGASAAQEWRMLVHEREARSAESRRVGAPRMHPSHNAFASLQEYGMGRVSFRITVGLIQSPRFREGIINLEDVCTVAEEDSRRICLAKTLSPRAMEVAPAPGSSPKRSIVLNQGYGPETYAGFGSISEDYQRDQYSLRSSSRIGTSLSRMQMKHGAWAN